MKCAVFSLLILGSVASAQGNGQNSVEIKSIATFTDGTTVESVLISPTGSLSLYFYQIKQADGTSCYAANTPSAATWMTPLTISCVK